MAQEIHEFAFVIPAGTAIATPLTQPLTIPQRVVQQINVHVPPGPRGNMGFRIGSTGAQLIPAIVGAWVVTDNQFVEYPMDHYLDSGSWQITGYNVGVYPHTVFVTFLCAVPGIEGAPPQPLVPLDVLNSSAVG